MDISLISPKWQVLAYVGLCIYNLDLGLIILVLTAFCFANYPHEMSIFAPPVPWLARSSRCWWRWPRWGRWWGPPWRSPATPAPRWHHDASHYPGVTRSLSGEWLGPGAGQRHVLRGSLRRVLPGDGLVRQDLARQQQRQHDRWHEGLDCVCAGRVTSRLIEPLIVRQQHLDSGIELSPWRDWSYLGPCEHAHTQPVNGAIVDCRQTNIPIGQSVKT